MSDLAQFVGDLNVSRFLDKLRVERNPDLRASLRRLLLEEEDKLGSNLEHLSRLQRQIADNIVRPSSTLRIEIERWIFTSRPGAPYPQCQDHRDW